ncbi:MAG: GlmU family protein [Flavobacteriales bacterium]
MNYILFDGTVRNALLPFTFTRPVAEIRVGILTIREKWEKFLGFTTTTITEEYLSEKYPMVELEENILINASFLPNESLVEMVINLKPNEVILQKEETDFKVLTEGRKSAPISKTNTVFNPKNIFLEEGARVECSILNANDGPIYIGKDAEVMEGCIIRGGFALGEHAVVKMGAKIYGPTTAGPHCRIGGEVNNSVLFSYSNKGHDGFLGNAVLGEWCNIGADSNNSNLKNNYEPVRLWSYETEGFARTGLQFCGLMMGDHSKCGINTMFNTGTVIGVSANIFGAGFPRNFVPSYSWGGASGFTTYLPKKAFETAKIMMERRGVVFDQIEADILNHVFEETKKWRKD